MLKRNFWFCAVEDPSSFIQHERIGVDNILLESDYPHCDSTWPHTQRTIARADHGLPDDIIRKMTWENASRLYQHPVRPPSRPTPTPSEVITSITPRTGSALRNTRRCIHAIVGLTRCPTGIGGFDGDRDIRQNR